MVLKSAESARSESAGTLSRSRSGSDRRHYDLAVARQPPTRRVHNRFRSGSRGCNRIHVVEGRLAMRAEVAALPSLEEVRVQFRLRSAGSTPALSPGSSAHRMGRSESD